MMIFTILFMVLGILIFGALVLLSVGGAFFTILASDVIVCIFIIILIIRFLKKKR